MLTVKRRPGRFPIIVTVQPKQDGFALNRAGIVPALRRSHSVDERGRITKYEYDGRSRLAAVVYPWSEEKSAADEGEAEEAGLYFTQDKGQGERHSFTNEEISLVRGILNRVGTNRGTLVSASQIVWRETYTYDTNGNRASKSTPWGTIRYEYDAENRMISRGDIRLSYDKDGNLVSEAGLRYEAKYGYNGENRMMYSEVAKGGTQRVQSRYAYDGLGRRTMEQDAGGAVMRTLYDGLGFEEIRCGVTFMDGSFTTKYATGIVRPEAKRDEGIRYRWLGDTNGGIRNGGEERETAATRYTGISVTLYGNGEAVGMSRSTSTGSRGGSVYLGKDILGSVRSASNEYGVLEDRYEYDAFGKPYKGEFGDGMNLGYTGKPYDAVTGLYNYGYRDYKPEAARFTTVDPVRDGNNWFAYVNNDPVNWVDPWGLEELYSEALVEFVKQAEGFSPTLYDDKHPERGTVTDLGKVEGTPTIGYGHTRGALEYLGKTITEKEADTLLREDLSYAAGVFTNPYNNYPDISSLKQHELDALIDVAFHSGSSGMMSQIGNFIEPLLQDDVPGVVTKDNRDTFIHLFTDNKSDGELNRGLNQAQLFLKGDYNGYPDDPTRYDLCAD